MMEITVIVLLILKIIGWLLLGLLGLLLVLILLVLFFPIYYRIQLRYEDSFSCLVRVMGVQVYPKKEKKGTHRHFKFRKDTETDTGVSLQQEMPDHDVGSIQKTSADHQEDKMPRGTEKTQTQETKKRANTQDTKKRANTQDTKKMHSFGTEQATGNKLSGAADAFQRFKAEFTDEGNKHAIGMLWRELKYLLRHIGPRRVKADVHFSLVDPANTGLATGVLSVCPFAYGKKCSIIPDFESEEMYFRGWAGIRGHARGIHVLRSCLHLLLDKDVRNLIHKIRK